MAITKKAVYGKFASGWSFDFLMNSYNLTHLWIEDAIRKYLPSTQL